MHACTIKIIYDNDGMAKVGKISSTFAVVVDTGEGERQIPHDTWGKVHVV
jgi:hypothetical protein